MNRRITKVLVANRGEIARRVQRTCRAMGIQTVAVHSDPDALSPHVAEADEAVRLAGATPAETYLRGDAVIDAARRSGADAIHPGYGFLAENGPFARACADAGLVFVGPPPDAIDAMGSKLKAKELMMGAGVPVLPGREITGLGGAELLAAGDDVGWPVLVKASYGGGGRGMRVVRARDELVDAVEAAAREAASAFGDGTVFLERYVDAPRHIEVQILGDHHGTVVHLFERECSIQRRHQKIVEECPSPAVDDEMRERLGAAAVAAGRAIGYASAGTVEFLFTPEGQFFFLEVNTRLQVEHPVTEAVTGLDLVRLQMLVAEGRPLPAEALDATIDGHAIEVRLYAEDATRGFLPSTGTLTRFRAGEGVRVDSGVEEGSIVSPFYDPMLAKVIGWAPTRDEAARRVARALRASRFHGVTTNRDLLVGILTDPEFLAGETDTHFLDRHRPEILGASPMGPADQAVHALGAALAAQAARRRAAGVLSGAPSGWRNNASQGQRVTYEREGERMDVEYCLTRGGWAGSCNGVHLDVNVLAVSPDEVVVEAAGIRRRLEVQVIDDVVYVDSALGASVLRARPRFPDPTVALAAGSLLAPMPGTVVRVEVVPGAEVEAGQVLVVIEAMKMEHRIQAPCRGRVSALPVSVGMQVDAATVLVVIDESGPSA